ncbi:molybdopterin-dependent oxidoreductase [Oceanithermus sp.]|uniref:molybdopterin-dependent oxidoreductase n=1 Tax=Oceanithermus sp. TaxID=2268145 RepID=UPI0025F096DF|nr:molybdopterin-dependent oxidoreductase [Oceanithermus sp.]
MKERMDRQETHGLRRREFLRRAGAFSAALGFFPTVTRMARAQTPPKANEVIIGKDPRLIVHNSKTGVLETPLEILREYEITPKQLLFIRNNQVLEGGKTLETAPLEGWPVEIVGMVLRPAHFDASVLKELPQHEVKMVLQCSGNGRSFFAKYGAKASGTQWQHGGMGQTVWKGPKLTDVLAHFKVEPHAAARFLTVNGRDLPPKTGGRPDFEHSLPWSNDPEKDWMGREVAENAILAIEMNGEPIPLVHGGPVRLIVPGYYGTMNVKWVGQIRFEAHESFNYNQVFRYRVPLYPVEPGQFDKKKQGYGNSRPNWRQKIKAVVFGPLDGEEVRAGTVKFWGVAWNDGVQPVEQVLVSADRGKTWVSAKLRQPDTPYGWYKWEVYLPLSQGEREVWVRAIDRWGRAQPLDGVVDWNPSGYEWNGADKVKVSVV